MTIQELKDKLLVLSNLYYIGEENLEINDDVISIIAERALSIYNQYRNKEIIVRREIQFGHNKFDTVIDENNIERQVENIKNFYFTPPYLSDTPAQFKWSFDRQTKILYSQLSGTFYIKVLVSNILDDIDINRDKEFIDIALGLYLQSAVEPFKGFNLTELPFENDGSELYEQGKELIAAAVESLAEINSNWYLAIE
jgi:hypothetical protein